MRIWNLKDNTQESVFQNHCSFDSSIAITGDNKYIVFGGAHSTVGIWNLKDKSQEAALRGHGFYVTSSNLQR